MRHWAFLAALVLAALAAGGAEAQSGDPDRTERQAALGHAAAIESAFRSVEARIGVTDSADLWADEWDGVSDPPAGDWWLQSWTDRGLAARYCSGVLAVFADDDELKGVGRDQRAVQVAPVAYGNGGSGLQIVLRNSRLYEGAQGRSGGSLPACMPILSTTGERVALVSEVADPKTTPTGLRWRNEDRNVSCPSGDTGTMTERRRIPIQTTAVTNCPAATPNCNDLIALAGSPPAWPADCAAREAMLSATPPTLPANAACSDWVRWRSNCRIVYAAAPAPADIPDATVTWEDGPEHTWTQSCSCSCAPGETVSGRCTQHWAQHTEIRVFVLRPGQPEIRTSYPAAGRTASNLDGSARLVNTVSTCGCTRNTPPPPQQPDSGTGSCPAGWSGTASWTQEPGESKVWDYSACSRSGTGSCQAGYSGTASWTQSYGQAKVWDYSACAPDTPVQQPTSGSQACPSPWSGTASWTQQPGQSKVWDFTGCSQSGTGSCPSPWSGTATWTQAYGQSRVDDYSGCSQSGTGACRAGETGTATWTQAYGGSQVWDYSTCTEEAPPVQQPTSGSQACPSPWTGTATWTQEPGESRVWDYSACSQSGSASCPTGWSGTAPWTRAYGESRVYDYSGCSQSGTGACQECYSGASSWTRAWGGSKVWDYSGCIAQTCSGTVSCPSGYSGTASWTREPGESRVYDYTGCTRSGTQACPSGWTGSYSWTQTFGESRVHDRSSCTRSGTGACPSGWTGSAPWTQTFGEVRQYDYGACSKSGTGACPDGQTGTATWTQAYGGSQVWDYSACTVVEEEPEDEQPTSGSAACTAPWTSGTMTWTQQPGESKVWDRSACCREEEFECHLDDSSSTTGTRRVCGDGSRTVVRQCGASSGPPPQQCDPNDPESVEDCTPGGGDPGQGPGEGGGD